MKIVAMFRILAGLILVQIALGGLVTFDFIGPVVHIFWEVLVFAFAIATWTGYPGLDFKPTVTPGTRAS
jgi:hypothetical protein